MAEAFSSRKKTAGQVAAIEEVIRATELAIKEVISYLRAAAQPTSEEAHNLLDQVLAAEDCECPEGHIVTGGMASAEPHAKGSGLLKKGGPIVIDVYPRSKKTGYFADMSRTICLGEPLAELKKMHAAVFAAQELAIVMLAPNVRCRNIQEAVEKYFADAGFVTSGKGKEFPYAEGFVHGVGHGVGLNVHETPRIGRRSNDILREGDIVTVEPGLYYQSIGGVRIEDMFLITKDGYRELTRFTKDLL